ncbi:hypothetical protein BABA_13120 [Neobacillus bataviensis LMG 21833]|uniref:Uncharacterized protein n=1 Tax=Neobacillus bataviensis LMG 21833 TaxID=1117379 RepID=K6D3L2_9BACI|nr:hypothetical protein [Neobacillus bataviensis]EKN67067.1 hypothetical protein BABA_13120 [Neobacillus bataviensis LMG 21833]
MNHHSFGVNIKKILSLVGCLVLLMILGACTSEENSNQSGYKAQYFEGKSDNWYVKMVSETESTRNYTISYIGEGNRPLSFRYEIYETSYFTEPGEGELKNQEEFDIYIKCSGSCYAVSNSIPVKIEWEGKEEEFVIRSKK